MSSFFAAFEDQFSEFTWPRLVYSAVRVPAYHFYFEILLIIGIVWLLFKRRYHIEEKLKLSQKEKDQLIKEWEPQPLVPTSWTAPAKLLERFHRASVGAIKKYVQFQDNAREGGATPQHLNMATLNFLDFIGDEELGRVAIKALRIYGLGACGPRGFYGTFDAHLTLETALERFLGVEEVALYSYGFSTIASAIPAYAKRSDTIFADEGVNQAIHEGLTASRSTVRFFRHNDMDHLEELLASQAEEDRADPKRASQARQFFVVEGLYLDYGDICPLKHIIDLKYKYKVRVLLDETISFGVLGAHGRGVTEHFGIGVEHVDVITGSLETAIGICGGFCAGSHYVVDHQRLSGQGYCFSASLPPLLAAAAEAAIERLESESGRRQECLRNLAQRLHKHLTTSLRKYWALDEYSISESPVKHIRLAQGQNTLERLEEACDLASELPPTFDQTITTTTATIIAGASADGGKLLKTPVLLTVARHLLNCPDRLVPAPSIRVALNCSLTDSEIDHVCLVLEQVGRAMAHRL